MTHFISSDIALLQRPRIAPVRQEGGTIWLSLTHGIEAKGMVRFGSRGTETLSGWTIGFAQVQWVETWWQVYRGLKESEGSMYVQTARKPARMHQLCFDAKKPGAIWYGDSNDAFPLKSRPNDIYKRSVVDLPDVPASSPLSFDVYHQDTPWSSTKVVQFNRKTGAINFLQAAQSEVAFCTALMARDPSGHPHFLNCLYWNAHWHYTFSRIPGSVLGLRATEVPGGVSTNVSRTFKGAPPERQIRELLKGGQRTTCNEVAQRAYEHARVIETTDWRSFDVRR